MLKKAYTNLLITLYYSIEDESEYLCFNSIDKSKVNDLDTFEHLTLEFLSYLKISVLPNYSIKLRIDTTIMLLMNLKSYVMVQD